MSTSTNDARPASSLERRLLGPTGGRALPIAVLAGAAVSILVWSLLPEAFAATALLGPLVAGYLYNVGPRAGATAGVASLAVSTPLQFALAAAPAVAVPSPFVLPVPPDPAAVEFALFAGIAAALVALLAVLGAGLGALGGQFGPDAARTANGATGDAPRD